LQENNFLGSGNRVSIAAQQSSYQKRYDFSFTNPYFTDEGMSLGLQPVVARVRLLRLRRGELLDQQRRFQTFLGLPITEYDTVSALVGIDSNEILLSAGTPLSIQDYINAIGARTFHAWRTQFGYSRDTRNDYFMPSLRQLPPRQHRNRDAGSTAEYWKAEYQYSRYFPLMPSVILLTASTSATATTTATLPIATCATT
jgi:outer membrane protein insertion porin family